jgi:hypothetical protein
MDIVKQVLSTSPVPYLSTAWSLLEHIYTCVQQVKTSKAQLVTLSAIAAHLVKTLNDHFVADSVSQAQVTPHLVDLQK